MQTLPGKRTALLTVSLVLSACGGGGGGGGGGGTVPTATPITPFTTWGDVKADVPVQLDGLGQEVSGTWATNRFIDVQRASAASEGYSAILTFDQALELTQLALKSSSTLVSFAGATFPDLTLAPGLIPQFIGAGSLASGNAAILANPINLKWDYQTFGIWETASTTDGSSRTFGAMSVGNDAGTAIPGSGTATFTGYATGSYVNAAGTGTTAFADLTVGVNFGTRILDFSTTNTQTSSNWDTSAPTFTPNGGLDLTGKLTYAAGTNSFTGSVSSVGGLTGDSTGQFYGPKAEELGGVFFLKNPAAPLSPETYAGAYGAAQTP